MTDGGGRRAELQKAKTLKAEKLKKLTTEDGGRTADALRADDGGRPDGAVVGYSLRVIGSVLIVYSVCSMTLWFKPDGG